MTKKSEAKKKPAAKCVCPYCEEEISSVTPNFCVPCGVTLHYCVKCHIPVGKDVKVCPQCGGPVE